MRILLVTHYFPPETGAPQARLSALARAWAADGDTVTVLTGMPNHPTGVIPPGAGSDTHAVQTCRVMTAFEPLAAELAPTWRSWSAT